MTIKPWYHHERYAPLPTHHMSKVTVLDLILQQLGLSFPQRYYQKCHKKTDTASELKCLSVNFCPQTSLEALPTLGFSDRKGDLEQGWCPGKRARYSEKGSQSPAFGNLGIEKGEVCMMLWGVRKRNKDNMKGQHSLPVFPFDPAHPGIHSKPIPKVQAFNVVGFQRQERMPWACPAHSCLRLGDNTFQATVKNKESDFQFHQRGGLSKCGIFSHYINIMN